MRELFTTLIANFDWDILFYDTITSDKFECSYGIKEDLDTTDANYDDMDVYREAVASAMLAADISDAVFTVDYTIYDYCVDLMGEPSSGVRDRHRHREHRRCRAYRRFTVTPTR